MKKFLWYIEKTYLWGRSLSKLKGGDVILLAGYPKTGSTWLRYFLFLSLRQKNEGLGDSMDDMNELMPEFAHRSFFKRWPFTESLPLLKTHQKFHSFYDGHKSVLIVRDPRDIVVSYYHYSRGVKSIAYDGTFSEILRHPSMGLESFFKHYYSWRGKAGLILRYEDFKENPSDTFSALAEFCGIERSQEDILSSIDGAAFDSMKKVQCRSAKLQSEFKEGHEFVRSGKKAQWKDLFTEEDLRYYEKLKKQYCFDLYE